VPRFKAGYWAKQATTVCWTGPLPAAAMGYAFSIGGLLCLVGIYKATGTHKQLFTATCHAHNAPHTDLITVIGCEVSSCFLVSMLFPELLEPKRGMLHKDPCSCCSLIS